jgi:rubrerythrin
VRPARGEGAGGVLDEAEIRALREALDDEHKAWATYDQVIRDLGPERPFSNIIEAEARHIEALQSLFQRYGLEVPENPWPGRVQRFASLREACEAGIQAEIENSALYERLLRSTSRPDILAVLRNLQRASQERHLPAFRRCASRGQGRGRGAGGRARR